MDSSQVNSHVQTAQGQQFQAWRDLKKYIIALAPYSDKIFDDHSEKTIKDLDIRRVKIGDKGAEMLAKAKMENLQKIIVWSAEITPLGGIRLFQAYWPKIKHINIGANIIGSEGVRKLVKMECPELNYLYLTGNQMGDRGARYLSEGNWPKLQTLGVWNNKLTQKGVKTLLKGNWMILKTLHINHNQLRSGSNYLFILPCISQLKNLSLSTNQNLSRCLEQSLKNVFKGQKDHLTM